MLKIDNVRIGDRVFLCHSAYLRKIISSKTFLPRKKGTIIDIVPSLNFVKVRWDEHPDSTWIHFVQKSNVEQSKAIDELVPDH